MILVSDGWWRFRRLIIVALVYCFTDGFINSPKSSVYEDRWADEPRCLSVNACVTSKETLNKPV